MKKKTNKANLSKKEKIEHIKTLLVYKLTQLDKTKSEFNELICKTAEVRKKKDYCEIKIYQLHMEIDKLQLELADLKRK